MKAEERHRLHDNDLQRLAETTRLRTKPFFERFGTTILFVLAAVIIVVAVAIWWFRSQDTSDAAVWNDLASVLRTPGSSAEDFADIADTQQYAGTTAAKWARLLEAESRLNSGLRLLFTDRQGALRELEAARKGFEALLEGPAVSPAHDVRVRFGLAKVLEVTSDGNLQPAIDAYEKVAADYPETIYQSIAEERIAALKAPSAKSFYAWFSKQAPEPVDPLQRPDDGATKDPFAGMFPSPGETPAGKSPTGETPGNTLKTPKENSEAESPRDSPTSDSKAAGKRAEESSENTGKTNKKPEQANKPTTEESKPETAEPAASESQPAEAAGS